MTKLMEQKIYKDLQAIKRELKFIKRFIYIPNDKCVDDSGDHELTEDEALKIMEEGEAEYGRGKTEEFETFLKREDPKAYKAFNAQTRRIKKLQKEASKIA